MAGIYRLMHRESITLANMKISAVDGTAFIDFSNSETAKLVDHLGYLIKIRDSSNRVIQGFAKAAGTGETLDAEALANGDFSGTWTGNLPQGWAQNGTVDAGSYLTADDANNRLQIVSDGDTMGIQQSGVLTVGKLYKSVVDIHAVVSGVLKISDTAYQHGGGITADATRYGTAGGTLFALIRANACDITVQSVSTKQVLTPSASGITIVDGKGSSTQSFAKKDSAFNYNDSSGYTVELWKVNNAVLLDTDSVLNADATIVMTDGSAAWSAVGIDDSAYLDGRHIIHITDAAGVVAFGYYKSAGAGAVVNANSGATQNWLYIGTGFSTAGNFTRKVYFVGHN